MILPDRHMLQRIEELREEGAKFSFPAVKGGRLGIDPSWAGIVPEVEGLMDAINSRRDTLPAVSSAEMFDWYLEARKRLREALACLEGIERLGGGKEDGECS